jgi:integrase
MGTHIKVVQEHLGHSSYAMTGTSAATSPRHSSAAADRLDWALHW